MSYGQEPKKVPDGTEGLFLTVPPHDSLTKKLPPNEFDGSYSTFRIGLGYIHDFVTYSQSKVFKQQMDSAGLSLDAKGKQEISGYLAVVCLKQKEPYPGSLLICMMEIKKPGMVRESGITIGVPELKGIIFVGRTKEGYSMVKVMNGHSPWAAERQMALDVIPILADGIKWLGYLPKSRIFWNLGYFNDVISEGQGFSTFEWQYVARVGWLPIYDKEKSKVLHMATNLRYAKPFDGKIALKSRPEANPAPQIINTGTFDANHSNHIGGEIYYSTGSLLIGSEVMVHNFTSNKSSSSNSDNHSFFGGDVQISLFVHGHQATL